MQENVVSDIDKELALSLCHKSPLRPVDHANNKALVLIGKETWFTEAVDIVHHNHCVHVAYLGQFTADLAVEGFAVLGCVRVEGFLLELIVAQGDGQELARGR